MADNFTNVLRTKGERGLRAPSVSSILEEYSSIATVECVRESMGPSSVDCPLHSQACWFGRKMEQMIITAKTYMKYMN